MARAANVSLRLSPRSFLCVRYLLRLFSFFQKVDNHVERKHSNLAGPLYIRSWGKGPVETNEYETVLSKNFFSIVSRRRQLNELCYDRLDKVWSSGFNSGICQFECIEICIYWHKNWKI